MEEKRGEERNGWMGAWGGEVCTSINIYILNLSL